MQDLVADWNAHGKAAIEACRKQSPARYLAVVASIVVKHLEPPGRPLEDVTSEQVQWVIEFLEEAQAASGPGGVRYIFEALSARQAVKNDSV